MSSDTILSKLNSSQKAAVSSTAQTLAILAGPGSGKTHTLTSRTAWLLKHEGLQPWNIIVATFTNKAAREMKDRIGKLIGDGMEAKLILGTFHSICRRYLARYGHLINVRRDFGIADSADSLAIIKRIVKRLNLTMDPATARSRISSRKAKGGQNVVKRQPIGRFVDAQEFETCYTEYEDALKRSNLLDYDDLLLRCADLLRSYPSCVGNIEAVLIDEFQDTNLVQFDLMRLFAQHRRRVTIVGDPDQSIYGFRSAETQNFKSMLTQYPETVTIPLEENYRSSGAILLAALEVIQQDESRISKPLMPTHHVGTQPVLRHLSSSHAEAQWIVAEIKRCLALTGDLLNMNDIAILLRSAFLSRHIEVSLGKAGIPYRMVGGHRFYDRVEVKIILDYLRVINQPDNNDALARIINVPPRRIGESTVKALLNEADTTSVTLWALILDMAEGKGIRKSKLTKPAEKGITSFMNIILAGKEKISNCANSEFSIKDLIEYVIEEVCLAEFLTKTYPDDEETRWANVQELINLATDFSQGVSDNIDDDSLPEIDEVQQDNLSSPLSQFLANIALASDVKATDAESPQQAQVTISTIHAAKGLEWPVVFIPATYEGSIPHSRAEDANEERRLLYVAMTRAKALLYMSYPCQNSRREQTTLSPFLTPRSVKPHLSNKGPSFLSAVTNSIAQILHRSCPNVDVNKATEGLESLEDDLFPLDGEEKMTSRNEWGEYIGAHHHIQNQRAAKRQRIDEDTVTHGSVAPSQIWRPAYTTTMTESTTFSIAATNLKSAFVTAGSHMQILNEQSVNFAAEKLAKSESHRSRQIPKALGTEQNGFNRPQARSTRRPEGQRSLVNFFGNQHAVETSEIVKAESVNYIGKSREPSSLVTRITNSQSDIFNNASSNEERSHSHSITPSLANHRLSSASLNAPARKLADEDSFKGKTYIFISSSPPRPERQTIEIEADQPAPTAVKHKSGDVPKSRAAQTLHLTTVQRINTLNAPVPRKTLGVRRSMNGWNGRNSQSFKTPNVVRRP